MTYSPDGQRVAAADDAGKVTIWDARSGEQVTRPQCRSEQGVRRRLQPRRQGAGHRRCRRRREAVERDLGCTAQELRGHTRAVWRLAFASDGSLFASSSGDGTVRLWDWAAGREVGDPVKAGKGRDQGPRHLPGRDRGRQRERRWRGDGVEYRHRPEAHRFDAKEEGTSAVAVSPDGRALATGGDANVVQVWELSSEDPIVKLAGHAGHDRALAFSNDGTMLAERQRRPLGRGLADGRLEEARRLRCRPEDRPLPRLQSRRHRAGHWRGAAGRQDLADGHRGRGADLRRDRSRGDGLGAARRARRRHPAAGLHEPHQLTRLLPSVRHADRCRQGCRYPRTAVMGTLARVARWSSGGSARGFRCRAAPTTPSREGAEVPTGAGSRLAGPAAATGRADRASGAVVPCPTPRPPRPGGGLAAASRAGGRWCATTGLPDSADDRAPGRRHDTRRGDDHVHLPPRARRPLPGRALPDGCAEHPARPQGHGHPPRHGGLLRHAPVPLLPRRPVPGVRRQRRGHARTAGAHGDGQPDEHRRRRGGAPRRGRRRRGRRRRARRRGRLLHEWRPGRLAGPGPAGPHRGRRLHPWRMAGAGHARLAPPGARLGPGRAVLRLGGGRRDRAARHDPGDGAGARRRRCDVHDRPDRRRRARLRTRGRALRPPGVRAALGARARACCSATSDAGARHPVAPGSSRRGRRCVSGQGRQDGRQLLGPVVGDHVAGADLVVLPGG